MSEENGSKLDSVPATVEAFDTSGYRVTFRTTAARVVSVTKWLEKRGFTPERTPKTTPDGTPICPKHGVPMRKREKQGDEWYSHNMGTEDDPWWCRGHKHATSPGWEVG